MIRLSHLTLCTLHMFKPPSHSVHMRKLSRTHTLLPKLMIVNIGLYFVCLLVLNSFDMFWPSHSVRGFSLVLSRDFKVSKEINEGFLLHGTKPDTARSPVKCCCVKHLYFLWRSYVEMVTFYILPRKSSTKRESSAGHSFSILSSCARKPSALYRIWHTGLLCVATGEPRNPVDAQPFSPGEEDLIRRLERALFGWTLWARLVFSRGAWQKTVRGQSGVSKCNMGMDQYLWKYHF